MCEAFIISEREEENKGLWDIIQKNLLLMSVIDFLAGIGFSLVFYIYIR